MPILILTSLSGIVLLASIIRVLRTRHLRQKSAALWIGVGLVAAPVMFFPAMLNPVAEFLHLASGSELALISGLTLLILLGISISREHQNLRNRSRILASELSSLRSQAGLAPAPALDGLARVGSPVPRDGTRDRLTDPLEAGPGPLL